MRIAINGFGRIGRSVFRILASDPRLQVVAVNDLSGSEPLAYLLKHDTVMGLFEHDVTVTGDQLIVGDGSTRLVAEADPTQLPWRELGVDVVVEATGRFRKRAELEQHLSAGAGRVLLTVPAKDPIDATVVLGVNDDALEAKHRIVSNASCTTNCLAPLAKVIDESFGIVKGLITTVHAYTNDQRLSDWYHADLRRSRAAGLNTIPTTTGAARAVGQVLPQLAGRLDGMAIRVPVPNGSIVDLVARVNTDATVESTNTAVREAAAALPPGILQYSTEAIVSSDIVGNPHSCIFDAPLTQVINKRTVKVFAWYDNEWGYSNRVVDLLRRLANF
ncbi:MAG: type I glyceraldehyde-3-phosphate dehydrogenase [Planctomycetota bacterium]